MYKEYMRGMPSKYFFSREEILAMPVISTNQFGWSTRDYSYKWIVVETFPLKNGEFSVSIKLKTDAAGKRDLVSPWGSYRTRDNDERRL